jgi:hypothetical protein
MTSSHDDLLFESTTRRADDHFCHEPSVTDRCTRLNAR